MTEVKEKIKERQELRDNALLELYEWHFNNNGKIANVAGADNEKRLAYSFLNDVGYASISSALAPTFQAKITASGILKAEEILLNR